MRVERALEAALSDIIRLDTRVYSSPLAEAWLLRAALLGAQSLAEVDGFYPSVAHIWMRATEVPAESVDAFEAGGRALQWLRPLLERSGAPAFLRHLAGVDPVADRAREERDDGALPSRLHDDSGRIRQVQATDRPSLIDLFAEVRDAIRIPVDPGWAARRYDLMERLAAEAGRSIRQEEPRELFGVGDVFVDVPSRLAERGVTRLTLPCLIGASRTLGFERRVDERALISFLTELSRDAREGLVLLEAMERSFITVAELVGQVRQDSVLPDIAFSLLALPAVDAVWLGEVLGDYVQLAALNRVIQKAFRELEDIGFVVRWAKRGVCRPDGTRSRPAEMWRCTGFNEDLELIQRSPSPAPLSVRSGRHLVSSSFAVAATRSDLSNLPPGRPWPSMDGPYQSFSDDLQKLDRLYSRWYQHPTRKPPADDKRNRPDFGRFARKK